MTEPTLFDEPTPFERGMAGSDQAATKWSPTEVAAVDAAIEACTRMYAEFTADEIWSYLGPYFKVTKGLAGRLNRFANAGLITATDRTRKSRRQGEHNHGQRLTIWKVL